jgi:hypothetical protein
MTRIIEHRQDAAPDEDFERLPLCVLKGDR